MDRDAAAKKDLQKKAPVPAVQSGTTNNTAAAPETPTEPGSLDKSNGDDLESQRRSTSIAASDHASSKELNAGVVEPSIEVSLPSVNLQHRLNMVSQVNGTSVPTAEQNGAKQATPAALGNESAAEANGKRQQSSEQVNIQNNPTEMSGNQMKGGNPNMAVNGMVDMNQMMQFMPNGMSNGMINGMMGSFPNMMGKFEHYLAMSVTSANMHFSHVRHGNGSDGHGPRNVRGICGTGLLRDEWVEWGDGGIWRLQ